MNNHKIGPQLLLALFVNMLFVGFNQLNAQDLNPSQWPHLKGYWKYQNAANLTKATAGKDLKLFGTQQVVAGPAIGDTAIRIGIGSYYECLHGMAPNGGGDSVNRYTLMFDFKILSFKKWHTFFKTDSGNINDGECFIRPNTGSNPGRIGVGATGYSQDSISPNQWYRLMISVNLNNYYRYYINGKLFHEGDTQEVDGRFALTPKMIFFGDDNQEDDTIDIASVAVFDTCLSAADIAKIGSIDPCVVKPPKLSLGRDTALCDYNSLVRNAGAGFKKYQWFNGSSQASITISKNIGMGKKNVWCKVTDANGCVVADTFILTYNASPLVTLGADQAFCQGLSTKLIGGTDTTLQYKWQYLPKGQVLSNKNNLTTDSSGTYKLTVTNAFGCFSSDTLLVTVYPRPAKPSITASGKTLLCAGETVNLIGPAGYFDYLWSNGVNGQSIGVNTNSALKLRVLDQNNCISFYSDSMVVKVVSLPAKPKLKLIGQNYFCFGSSVSIEAPSGYFKYLWEDGSTVETRNIASQGGYYVRVTDSNLCTSANSDTITLTVNPRPAQQIIKVSGKTDLCPGDTLRLSILSGNNQYLWSDSSKNNFIQVSQSGKYSVAVMNGYGCQSEWSDSVKVTFHPFPLKPTVVKIAGDTLQCNRVDSIYSWARNGSVLNNNKRLLKTLSSGYYQVQTSNGWCLSPWSDSFLHANIALQRNSDNEYLLKVFPNPFNSQFILKLKSNLQGDVLVVIIDAQGKEVFSLQTDYATLLNGLPIQMEPFNKGIYQLQIVGANSIESTRLVKY